MKKKVLFISYDGMTDPLGQSQVIPYLSGLTKYGYEFIILSCEKPARFTAANKEYVLSLLAPFPIKWEPILYHKSPPVLSSVYDFNHLKRKAVGLHKKEVFDLVHTRVGLPTLLGLWLKKNYKIKFLNDIRGFWADERIDGGMWNIKNPVYKLVYKFFRKRENEFITNADYNTCLTYAARNEIHTWKLPNQLVAVEVIPCCVDMDLFDPHQLDISLKNKLKIELGIADDDIIISYLGSIGGWYLIDEMMRFCKLLSDKIPKAKFLFISPHLHDTIAAAAGKYDLSADKLIVRKGKRHEVPALLSFSDYSVFFIKPCYSKISSSPTKHGEIMAMGIPVITNRNIGDVDEIITKYHSGYLVNDFSEASFNLIVDKIAAGNVFNKETIRAGAKDFYALEIAIERYNKVYMKIFSK